MNCESCQKKFKDIFLESHKDISFEEAIGRADHWKKSMQGRLDNLFKQHNDPSNEVHQEFLWGKIRAYQQVIKDLSLNSFSLEKYIKENKNA